MENMKAVRVHNYGGPEVLRFEDAPPRTPINSSVASPHGVARPKSSSPLGSSDSNFGCFKPIAAC